MRFGKLLLALSIAPGVAVSSSLVAKSPEKESYFGHYDTTCPAPDTSDRHGFKGGVTSSEPPATDQMIVAKFVNDPAVKENSRYINSKHLSGATIKSCKDAIKTLSSNTDCTEFPLFLVGDGEIRKSWACHGAYAYDMYFTIQDARISNIWAKDGYRSPVPIVSVRQ